MVLAEKSRADACVINRYKLIIVIGLLRVLPVVHVTQVVLLSLEEDDSKAIQSQCTADVIIENSCAQVEPLVVLAGLCQLALLLGQLAHLKVYVRLLHKVALLDSSFSLHDQVLGRFSRSM